MIKWTRERTCEVPEKDDEKDDKKEVDEEKCHEVQIKIVGDNARKVDLDDFWPRRKRTDVTRYYYHF